MTSAYLEFVEELFESLNDVKDNKKVIRKLNTAYNFPKNIYLCIQQVKYIVQLMKWQLCI